MVNRCDDLLTLRYDNMMVINDYWWYGQTNLLMFDNHDKHFWKNDYRSFDDNFDHIAKKRDSENHMQKVLKEKRQQQINYFISFSCQSMWYIKKNIVRAI